MKVYKDPRMSWKAESEVVVGERLLQLLTMRRSNGDLVTTVKAVKNDGIFAVYRPFSDFNRVLESSRVRLTEKACRDQHLRWDCKIQDLAVEAEKFYNLKGE